MSDYYIAMIFSNRWFTFVNPYNRRGYQVLALISIVIFVMFLLTTMLYNGKLGLILNLYYQELVILKERRNTDFRLMRSYLILKSQNYCLTYRTKELCLLNAVLFNDKSVFFKELRHIKPKLVFRLGNISNSFTL